MSNSTGKNCDNPGQILKRMTGMTARMSVPYDTLMFASPTVAHAPQHTWA